MAPTGGYVTTHVLDTAKGCPAAGLKIEVFRLTAADGQETRQHVRETMTNDDGRTDSPIIEKDEIQEAIYEIVFHAGAYLDVAHGKHSGVRFLDQVPIRFGVTSAAQHYHVPLLLSPFGYATYRGS